MQTIRPATALHGTAGVLVDDNHFAVLHDVIYVARKQRMGAQSRGDVMHQHNVGRRIKRFALFHNALAHQQLFHLDQAALGHVRLTRFLIDPEIAFALEIVRVFFLLTHQARNDFINFGVHFRAVFRRTGDNQRRTRFVDQNGVDLIHQRIVQLALHALFRTERHVVAQIVEAIFVVGAVGNIRCVGFTLGHRRHARQVNADAQAQEFEQRTVIFRIALRQVVVDGHDVHAFTAQRIKVCRQGRSQRFTFTGTHLCDTAIVQHHAADQLHVKVTHAEDALTCFTHRGERFRDQAFQRLALFQALAELVGFRFQLIVRKFFEIRLHLVDDVYDFAHAAQGTIVAAAKHFS